MIEGSGSGSGRPKNMWIWWIQIHNTGRHLAFPYCCSGRGDTLHVHTAGGGRGYTLHVHTTGLVVVKGIPSARPNCRYWKKYTLHIYKRLLIVFLLLEFNNHM
jgi:hypothetical protein